MSATPAEVRGRDESREQRLDRNWGELLQELRVTQTGVQLLTGFLVTLPFQARFPDLDAAQRRTYLVLLVTAVVTTVLLLGPVVLHRSLFARGQKEALVRVADRLTRTGMAGAGLLVTGVVLFVVDVVAGRTAGLVAAASVLALVTLVWVVVPWSLRRAR